MAFRTNGCLMCHIISQPHLAEADQSLESCPKVSRDSWWRRISAWSLGVQAPTTDTKSNYQSSTKFYKYITSTNTFSNMMSLHQKKVTPSKISNCFPKAHDVRLHISASCSCCLWPFGYCRSIFRPWWFLHHDIEKLHFHNLAGKTKKDACI